jgi:galactokinase
MTDPSVAVLIINTNVRHKLADGEYAKRRATCEAAAKSLGVRSLRDVDLPQLQRDARKLDSLAFRRARHVVTENDRTLKAARAIGASDWAAVGKLMYASHASLRDDYEVSCPELDAVVEAALAIGEKKGMIGCRMTGGGFGGCAVSLVRTESAQQISKQLSLAYERKTNITPFLFTSRPGSGARMLLE